MKKTMMSWSSGKDSAWSLYQLQQDPTVELVGLFSVLNKTRNRVAMHAVRHELLKQQAQAAGLPLTVIEIPEPCSNEEYAQIMAEFTADIVARGITHCAFGDLFLEDIRQYRENLLKGTGITPVFPLWKQPTDQLIRDMLAGGLKTVITCVDPKQLAPAFSGRWLDEAFLAELPESVDPCGENGEFHSMVVDGPMFSVPIAVKVGETIERQGFYYTDILPG